MTRAADLKAVGLEPRPCRYCGRPIVFARDNQTDVVQVLDVGILCYGITEGNGRAVPLPAPDGMASHWQTCPKAAQAKADMAKRRPK